GISEDSKVEAPAFTDAIRMYRQSKEQYGTWDMLCGNETQVLSNLVMEELLPELRSTIGPRLKGKAPERQRAWIQVSDAVYRMVYELAKAQYDAAVARCEQERPQLESTIRTDMDQIITSKEHLASKIRALVLPKAEVCVRNHVQPYISSILEALMTPTSQGFAEAREVFFKEVTDMNMNVVNEGGLEKLVEYMEKLSHLAFHPVKMQSCYEKMDQLKLEGLQQRFDVSSTSVFKQRAQIHMRQQMDDAVYTFETLLHQELGKLQGKDDLCKSIQRILERVLKKFDYDSSTVRKKFFREALLQITIPFLLKKLAPTCKGELAKFQELIFEDFASFILVENTYEEVVLQSVMKDIMQAEVLPGAGEQRSAPASPMSRADVPSEAEVPHATPRSSVPASPVSGADVPSGAEMPHATPRSSVPASPVSGADVPSGAEVPQATPRSSMPASPASGADVPSGAEVPQAAPRSSMPASPVPGADPPSVSSVPHATPAAPSPRADVPAEAQVPRATPAAPGARSPAAACHQRGANEPGEHGERSPPRPRGTTESGEGVQTEF
ncbi:NIBL1 protein, partial [Chaetorhynchus papuensis]|nr:NIBL1 protein [Chaetorhynchus papuensis]